MSACSHVPRIAARRTLSALAVAAALALALAPEAGAKRAISTGVAAMEYHSLDGATRDLWFDRTVDVNAELVRVDVIWRDVGRKRPANPRDPADPAYHFSGIDAAVREAAQRGLKVQLTVFGVPGWAMGAGDPPPGLWGGAWRPDAGAYGNFGTALAKRYSGSFSPAAGQPPLPRVRYFEAWNEPNLEVFLAPQWVGDRAEGPAIYRELLNSFYDAVKGVDRGNTVISGGTPSFGDPPGGDRTRPVFFLRELFCLEGKRKLRPRAGCGRVRMDALGYHPINIEYPPTYSAIHPDDAAMSDIDRLRRVLRAAEKAGVVPGGRRPIWATEFWWDDGVPMRTQARYVEQALYVLWKQRVKVAIHYFIRDHKPIQGLFLPDGSEKPASRAFRFPFVAERLRRKRVRAWGRSPKAGWVKVQRKKGGGWKTLKRIRVRENEVFTARLRGSKQMRARIGGERSLVW